MAPWNGPNNGETVLYYTVTFADVLLVFSARVRHGIENVDRFRFVLFFRLFHRYQLQ